MIWIRENLSKLHYFVKLSSFLKRWLQYRKQGWSRRNGSLSFSWLTNDCLMRSTGHLRWGNCPCVLGERWNIFWNCKNRAHSVMKASLLKCSKQVTSGTPTPKESKGWKASRQTEEVKEATGIEKSILNNNFLIPFNHWLFPTPWMQISAGDKD